MNDHPFAGFDKPQQNYSKLPHAFIDASHIFTSQSEIMVVLYILRHTWGFSEYDEPKKITLDEFENGRKYADGTRMDNGCGMSRRSIQRGLADAEAHGFITVEVDDTDKARVKRWYSIRMSGVSDVSGRGVNVAPQGCNIDTPGVQELHPDQRKKPKKETLRKKPKKESPPGEGASASGIETRVRGYIAIYAKMSQSVVADAYAKWHDDALVIAQHDAGITTQEFAAFLDGVMKSEWYAKNQKVPTWEAIGKNIVRWVIARRKEQQEITEPTPTGEGIEPVQPGQPFVRLYMGLDRWNNPRFIPVGLTDNGQPIIPPGTKYQSIHQPDSDELYQSPEN